MLVHSRFLENKEQSKFGCQCSRHKEKGCVMHARPVREEDGTGVVELFRFLVFLFILAAL